jgi:hypothetical protein
MVAYRFLLHSKFLSETWFLYGDAKYSRMLVNSLSNSDCFLYFSFSFYQCFRCCDVIQELDNYNSVHVSFSSWLIWLCWFMSIASCMMGLLWFFLAFQPFMSSQIKQRFQPETWMISSGGLLVLFSILWMYTSTCLDHFMEVKFFSVRILFSAFSHICLSSPGAEMTIHS